MASVLHLVSQSARRRLILEKAGYDFDQSSLNLSENLNENMSLSDAIQTLARDKVEHFLRSVNEGELLGKIIMGADTMVAFEGQALGKPQNLEQAEDFLRRLSGKNHQVLTAICLYDPGQKKWISGVKETKVEFRSLSTKEIGDYVLSGKTLDKAGGYGIQEEGGQFVKKFDGPFDNVMGLSLRLLDDLCAGLGCELKLKDESAYEKRQLRQRLSHVEERINQACLRRRGGGSRCTPQLLAVSKFQPGWKIEELFYQGQTRFGENYVQEANQKWDELRLEPSHLVKKHFIGHLQSNKIAKVVGIFDVIQSVDSIKTLDRINDCAQRIGTKQEVFIQANIAKEPTKSGFDVDELSQLSRLKDKYSHVLIGGMMMFPPLEKTDEATRDWMKKAKELHVKTADQLGLSETELSLGAFSLSLGTSQDFEVAIEEGSSMVRLGEILMGPRPRNK